MKIGLVYSFEDSDWFSVTKIVGNLLSAYSHIGSKGVQIKHINFSEKGQVEDNELAAKEAGKAAFDKLIFLDHKPHPFYFLKCMGSEGISSVGEIIFHVFGDFTLTLGEWRRTQGLLTGKKVKFVCASDKQVALIRKFCRQKEIVFKSPFPVNCGEFHFDSTKKNKVRKSLRLNEGDFAFLYVGRLSRQKKIKELVELFLKLKKEGKLSKKHKLFIAGKFDTIGMAYLQDEDQFGECFRRIQRVLENTPAEFSKDVVFLGSVKNSLLKDYYNAADCFVSFSTYHDEDYGMAVAEALCCGLPAVLTDWAGYSSFKVEEADEATSFVPTFLGERQPDFDRAVAYKLLEQAGSSTFDDAHRERFGSAFKSRFSVEATAETLSEVIDCEVPLFDGYTELLNRLGANALMRRHIFMSELTKTFNDYYFKVYNVYAE